MTPPAYFERQSRQLCLRHTLNNLLQRRACTNADLDAIAAELPGGDRWVGPHRTVWLGNYDVNILSLALARHSKVRRLLSSACCRLGASYQKLSGTGRSLTL